MADTEKKFTLVSERFQRLRLTETIGKKGKPMTQEEFAASIHLSPSTVKRYETKNPVLTETALLYFARYFKTTINYLIGETEIKDPLLYYQEEMRIEDEALDAYETECRVKVERIKALFELCGYSYENIENSKEYIANGFAEALGEKSIFPGPHKLTDPEGLNDTIYLSDEELENIKRLLGDAVAFECFRIKRGRDKKDGNG